MNPSDGMLPPTDPATEKELAETLQDLNRKLRSYFEINVNQNTNAIAQLLKKISALEATNADLEKTLKEVPNATKQVADAVKEINKLKEQELNLIKKKDYEKKQAEARVQAGEEFDRKRAREKQIIENFDKSGELQGIEGLTSRAVEALFSKKARKELVEDYKEYTEAVKNVKNRDRKKSEQEEREEYIEKVLAKKGLKNEYSLQSIVGTAVGDELTKLTKKVAEEEKQPPVEVILTDINRPALNKLTNLFNGGGGGSGGIDGGLTSGTGNVGRTIQPTIVPPSRLPAGPTVLSLPGGTGANTPPKLPPAPAQKALPSAPVRPLLGPGDDAIDIGGPTQGRNLNPNRPPMRNVTPSKAGNVLKTTGRAGTMIGGRAVPALGAFLFGYEAGTAMRDIPAGNGMTIGGKLDDAAFKIYGKIAGLTDEQMDLASGKRSVTVKPAGSLIDTPEPEENSASSSIAPYGDTLSSLEMPPIKLPDENNNIQDLTTTLKEYTDSVNKLIVSGSNKTTSEGINSTTTLGNVNNSAVNNVIYNADNKINTNRDMFKETIKFNYKLLK